MSWLMELLKNVPVSAVMRERLQLAEDRIKKVQDHNQELESKNAELTAELERLRSALPDMSFVDAEGVLWKKRRDGRFESKPYCPKCKLAMSAMQTALIGLNCYRCTQCKFYSPFEVGKESEIVASLA